MKHTFFADQVELRSSEPDANGWTWNQIAKQGHFKGHSAGEFALTIQVFEEIIRNFKAGGQPVHLDFEHSSEENPTVGSIPQLGCPAAGWIHDLKIVDGKLMGLTEFLEPAKSYIKNGQYKFFSPAIRFKSRDRVTGEPVGAKLTSTALTNAPYLSHMLPLAAKDTTLPEDITLEAIAAAVTTAIGSNAAPVAKETPQDMDTAKLLKDAEVKSVELSLKLKETETRAAALEAEVVALRAENEKRVLADQEEEVTSVLLAYKDSKGLAEENRADLLTLLSANPTAFRKLYPKVPAAQAYLMRTVAAGEGKDSAPTVVKSRGFNDKEFRALSDKYQKEGATLEDAIQRAYAEILSSKESK